MNAPTISVCLATYQGVRYVQRQLESILDELGSADEVVIVDDHSQDGTLSVIEAVGDPRIRCYRNEANRREVYSFERAISMAKNEFIFLSDQDDVWIAGRVGLMVRALQESGALLVTTNFDVMDDAEEPLPSPYDGVSEADSRRHLKNVMAIFLGRTNYFGCAMAFRRELKRLILPIPSWIESHDLWIALAANLARRNAHSEAKTLRKRQHGQNVTSPVSPRPLHRRIRSRLVFARSLAVLAGRRLRPGRPPKNAPFAGGASSAGRGAPN